jgi:hypothetical protein
MNLVVSFFLFLLMTGWSMPSHKVKRAALGQEFTLRVGEQVQIKETGLKISFSAVTEDSRCPKGVDCIWAGNGKVVVQINVGRAKSAEIEVNTNVEPKQSRFQEYSIKLVSLNPYPHKDVKIKRSDYVVTLVVNKGDQAATADER